MDRAQTGGVPEFGAGIRKGVGGASDAPVRWGRLVSLDVMRGATIAGMLLVNNPGDWAHVYPALRHAEWHGWTPTDLIFPFFLFIMGTAMAFSLPRQRARGEAEDAAPRHAGRRAIAKRTIRRVLLLVGLGLLLSRFPEYDLGTLRMTGVLQRIGLVYLLAVPIVLVMGPAKRSTTFPSPSMMKVSGTP